MNDYSRQRGIIYTTLKDTWQQSITRTLNSASLTGQLARESVVLIKPNLVEALAPPVTTPVECVEQLVLYLKNQVPGITIIVGEGTGSVQYPTQHCFETLGYTEMASRQEIELIDLNYAPLQRKELAECSRWPELYLPAILDDVFLISVPVLKAHTLSRVTLTMKNMMGCAPPAHYQQGGCWGKSAFHERIHAAIYDLNRYRTPDFTLLDATVGMSQAHLWGDHCNPPVNRLAASWDPVAIDSYGCSLLNRNWHNIGHISMAHATLGQADPLEIREL